MVHSYYDVQSLSLRNALYSLAVAERDGFKWEQAFVGGCTRERGGLGVAGCTVLGGASVSVCVERAQAKAAAGGRHSGILQSSVTTAQSSFALASCHLRLHCLRIIPPPSLPSLTQTTTPATRATS